MSKKGKLVPVSTRKSMSNYGVIQMLPRGVAVTLSLFCITSASVCISKLTVEELTLKSIPSTRNLSSHNAAEVQHHHPADNPQLVLYTQVTAGWIILASLAVLLYQTFSMIQIPGFICISVLFMKIPELVVNTICIISYAPAAVVMAVCTYQWTVPIVFKMSKMRSYHDQQLNSFEYESWFSQYIFNFILPVAFTCIFAFASTVYFIKMMMLSILIKIMCHQPPSKQDDHDDV